MIIVLLYSIRNTMEHPENRVKYTEYLEALENFRSSSGKQAIYIWFLALFGYNNIMVWREQDADL